MDFRDDVRIYGDKIHWIFCGFNHQDGMELCISGYTKLLWWKTKENKDPVVIHQRLTEQLDDSTETDW